MVTATRATAAADMATMAAAMSGKEVTAATVAAATEAEMVMPVGSDITGNRCNDSMVGTAAETAAMAGNSYK